LAGPENLLGMIPGFLGSSDSNEFKLELLLIVEKYEEYLSKIQDLKTYVTPILNGLCSKLRDIRVISENILDKLVPLLTVQPFVNAIREMKEAQQSSLNKIFARFLP